MLYFYNKQITYALLLNKKLYFHIKNLPKLLIYNKKTYLNCTFTTQNVFILFST